jgi:Short C-terminal domain
MFNAHQIVAKGPNGQPFTIPYRDTSMEVGGPGRIKSGGGFIGGGFGGTGALEGMAVASVLNSLSTKTRFETIITITSMDCQLICVWDQGGIRDIQLDLAPVFGRLRKAQQKQASSSASDVGDLVTQLAGLTELHASGALSDEEFESAKQRVIAKM